MIANSTLMGRVTRCEVANFQMQQAQTFAFPGGPIEWMLKAREGATGRFGFRLRRLETFSLLLIHQVQFDVVEEQVGDVQYMGLLNQICTTRAPKNIFLIIILLLPASTPAHCRGAPRFVASARVAGTVVSSCRAVPGNHAGGMPWAFLPPRDRPATSPRARPATSPGASALWAWVPTCWVRRPRAGCRLGGFPCKQGSHCYNLLVGGPQMVYFLQTRFPTAPQAPVLEASLDAGMYLAYGCTVSSLLPSSQLPQAGFLNMQG